jgi:hypothetical protein
MLNADTLNDRWKSAINPEATNVIYIYIYIYMYIYIYITLVA